MLILNHLTGLIENVFQQFNQKKLLIYCCSIFLASFGSYFCILFLNGSGSRFVPVKFRRFLFINADKSETGALQVGGIVFSLVSMLSITMLFSWFPYLISNHQFKIISCAFQSWVGILIYGYLDDCFEIRPIVKLSLQLGVIFLFCLRVSNVIFPEHSALAFVVLIFLSVAIINGSNLLDGLDTLTFKFSTVIYLSFILIAAPINNITAFFIGLTCICNMTGFYFFNRDPSKIHLGEIGVSSLGLSYVVLSVLIFDSYKGTRPLIEASSLAVIPCVLPIVELGVSFLRRFFNNKSPLRGDKLHNHHILNIKKGLSPSLSSTILAGLYLVGIVLTLIIVNNFNSVVGIFFLTFFTLSYYLIIGGKYWFGQEFKLNLNILQKFLVKKEVKVMPSNAMTDFKIVINNTNKSSDKDLE